MRRDVRDEKEEGSRGGVAMPDHDPIEAGERALDRTEKRREDKRGRKQQQRLGTADLTDVAGCRLVRRARDHPQRHVRDHQGDERRRSGVGRDPDADVLHRRMLLRARPR